MSLVAVVSMAALGFWQLQRAAAKEALTIQIEKKSKLDPLENEAIARVVYAERIVAANSSPHAPAQALVHRKVNLRGLWLHQHTVFLDNRFMVGRPGFVVVTPLQLQDSHHVVWVQRGWVARDPLDRTRIPDLLASTDPVTVHGSVIAEVSRIYSLGATVNSLPEAQSTSALASTRASRIWQNLPTINIVPPLQLMSLAVLQTSGSEGAQVPDGLKRDWLAQDSGVAKHYGYAFQWFGLCGLIIVLYVWFQLIAPRRSHA